MRNNTFETLIGTLVLVVAIVFIYISSKFSSATQNISSGYKLKAEFSNIEGLNVGSDVKISGVKVGSVLGTILDNNTYKAVLTIKLPKDILIPVDSSFKVSTSGLIGVKFINIKIGGSEEYFKDGDKVDFTESTMDLEDLIGRFVFNKDQKNEK